MKRLLKIVPCIWNASGLSRDMRELSAAKEAGFEVAVMSKGEPEDRMRETEQDGMKVYLCSTRPVKYIPVRLNRVISFFQWVYYARKYHADVLSCHNLIALAIGYLSTFFMSRKKAPKLVYDAHEFELGVCAEGERSKLASFLIKHAESFLMRKTAFNIMVNDTIAEETMRIHGLKEKPLVIRNIPPNWKLDTEAIAQQRREFLKQAPPPPHREYYLIMYHGSLTRGRGIRNAIRVLAKNPNLILVVMGNASTPEYLEAMLKTAEDLKVSDRLIYRPAVPYDELYKYVGAVDVELMTGRPVCQSYVYSLPNKFFESIQSLTPLVCSDFVEIRKIVNDYGIGLICDPEDIDSINSQIERLRTDKDLYQTCKKNLIRAKSDLCWENEKAALVGAYRQLIE